MSGVLPLSVFIIACNEGDRIATTIRSVKGWVDEIIVVDSGSTDNTVSVSEAEGARVIYHAWVGYGLQKRFAEEQCRNHWLLALDADEEITSELAQEISQLFAAGEPAHTGYVLRIRDLLPGETTLAPLAHTNYVLRLYDRRRARFSESPVHDSVQLYEGDAVMLKHPVLHRSFRSLSHAVAKLNAYSDVQAENLRKKGLAFAPLRLLIEFPVAFFKGYIIRGYILRGARGFSFAMLYAFIRFLRIAKYLEK